MPKLSLIGKYEAMHVCKTEVFWKWENKVMF